MDGTEKKEIEAFRLHLIREEKSQATIQKYIRDIHLFYSYIEEGGALDKEAVIRFKSYLLNLYTVNSANSILAAVNSFLDFLELGQLRVKRYKLQKKLFCTEATELSKEEYMRLLEVCLDKKNERLYLIMQTICSTGIRISELEYFTVEAIIKGHIEVYCKSKVRIVFIPEQLRMKLLQYMKYANIETGPVFITKNGNPINRSNVWTQMKGLCKKAEIPESKVFPHNLRHLFARTFYSMERDINKLADVLGHSSIETTRVYTISSGSEHKKQVSSLGLVV